jgi:hypothetical protein
MAANKKKAINLYLATIFGAIQLPGDNPTVCGTIVVDKDKQCRGCEHKEYPDGGWCYMFKEFQPGCVLNKSGSGK